jgi:crossover junction endodeoxyribonuclease RusA
VEIKFPIEFVVNGTPVSLQARRSEARDEWKDRVRSAARTAIPDPHFVSELRMAVTLYYMPSEPMQGDIDNIVKPILDAMSGLIYLDDRQVERLVVQKFEPDNDTVFARQSDVLTAAWQGERPTLYVRVSNDPNEELV